MAESGGFWDYVDWLVAGCRVVIDRPKGSAHPRYPTVIYPVDYGYLEGTSSSDGGGIDVWVGARGMPDAARPDVGYHADVPLTDTSASEAPIVDAVICTIDLLKRDTEIKLLIGCTDVEKEMILALHNAHTMRGLLIRREMPGY